MVGGEILTAQNDWALEQILEMDRELPGMAGHFLRASSERRHVIAAYLAATKGEPRAKSTANFLKEARHTAILAAAYGQVPHGLRGALRRCGAEIQPLCFYGELSAIFIADHKLGRLLMNLEEVSATRMAIAQRLPVQMRSAKMVMLMRDINEAAHVADLFSLFCGAGANADRLANAMLKARSRADITGIWRNSLEDLVFQAGPLGISDVYFPVSSARQLKRTALGYRNCARRYLTNCLEGTDSFAVFKASGQKLVVHLRQRSGHWVLDDIYAMANGRVHPEARSEAVAYLARHGIRQHIKKRRTAGKWEPLREVMGRWEFDHEIETAWG